MHATHNFLILHPCHTPIHTSLRDPALICFQTLSYLWNGFINIFSHVPFACLRFNITPGPHLFAHLNLYDLRPLSSVNILTNHFSYRSLWNNVLAVIAIGSCFIIDCFVFSVVVAYRLTKGPNVEGNYFFFYLLVQVVAYLILKWVKYLTNGYLLYWLNTWQGWSLRVHCQTVKVQPLSPYLQKLPFLFPRGRRVEF